MRVDDDLLRGADAVPHDLLEGLIELGAGPAPTPSAALQLFLAEQQVASLPVPRAAAAVAADVVPVGPPTPSRPGRHRVAGRVASLGLMAKVLLGSGVALAGMTGAGAAGALPSVLQDAWDGVVDVAPGGGAVPDEPAEPDASSADPTAPSGSDPAPAVAPAADRAAGRPAPVEQQETTTGRAVSDVPAAGTGPAPAADEVPEATADAAQEDAPAVQDAAVEPAAPSSPRTAEEQTATHTGTTSGDTWTPVSDDPTTAPSESSTSAPSDATTWEPDQPASAPPYPAPADTGTGPDTGTGTTVGGMTGSGATGATSGSGGW